MNTKTWWKEAVVYQIYPRSFQDSNSDGIGDIKGIISRLDYLKQLGVDVLWLSPVYQSPNKDNGYDISNYQAIHPEFGTMEDFDTLLAQAHKRGLKIIMDLVVNHTSDQHDWFIESRASANNPHRDFYIWKEGVEGKEPNNWGSIFGGSAWQYDNTTDMYFLHMFAKEQPDLNWENESMRRAVYDMMCWWCDKGIDGFRMDVISMISKDPRYLNAPKDGGLYASPGSYVFNGPKVHEYLQEMNQEVLSRYDIMTVGETAGVTVEEAKRYAGEEENELSMVFQFEHVDIGNGKLGKWTTQRYNMPELRSIISKWQTQLEGKAWNSIFWGNHDQPRAVSRFGNDSEKYRTISAKMLATCQFMLKGTPYIYQGEELGMSNAYFPNLDDYQDLESINFFHEFTENHLISEEDMMKCLMARGRDNARTPMHWDDSPCAGFTTGTPWLKMNPNYPQINAAQQLSSDDSVYHYYQQLIALRKQHEVVLYGKYELLEDESESIWAFQRILGNEKIVVLCNFSPDTILYDKLLPAGKQLIGNYGTQKSGVLRPYEGVVYHTSNV